MSDSWSSEVYISWIRSEYDNICSDDYELCNYLVSLVGEVLDKWYNDELHQMYEEYRYGCVHDEILLKILLDKTIECLNNIDHQ